MVLGEIDPATSVPLADALAPHLLAAEPGTCVGLRVLLEATATARSRGVVLAIVVCPPCSSRPVELTGTADPIDAC